MQDTYNRCTIGGNGEEGGDCNEEGEAHGFQISERSEGGMPYGRWKECECYIVTRVSLSNNGRKVCVP